VASWWKIDGQVRLDRRGGGGGSTTIIVVVVVRGQGRMELFHAAIEDE
jgi:hypothetical protein